MQSGSTIRYGAVQYVHSRQGRPPGKVELVLPTQSGLPSPEGPHGGHNSFASLPGSQLWVFFDPVQSPPFRGPMVLARLPRFGWSVDAWIW